MNTEDLYDVRDATDRLLATLAGLDDATARGPSLLPGWSVGHVLTHLARNADGNTRMAEGAARGEVLEQYPHGQEGRAADIEAGSGRPAAELVADVRASAARLDDAWAAMPPAAWDHLVRPSHREVPVAVNVISRRREVEIHHVDLGLTFRPVDWPPPFVALQLDAVGAGLSERLPAGTALRLVATDSDWVTEAGLGPASVSVSGAGAWLLAWMTGRPVPRGELSAPAGLPALAPW
jgi:maleylpyruvate isomerase